MTDKDIVGSILGNYKAMMSQSIGNGWYMVKIDDDVIAEFDARLRLHEGPLTPEVQAEILADFSEWSGGFAPHEVEPERVRAYCRFSLDRKYDEDVVRSWMLDSHRGFTQPL